MTQESRASKIWGLFSSFLGISAVALGGGLVMVPMMRDSFVVRRQWLTDEDMVDTVAAMQSMPGLIMGNMGALIGYRVAGIAGSVAAIAGGALPPVVAIALLAEIVRRFRNYPIVQGAFGGVRAAVAALILLSVIKLTKQIILSGKTRWNVYTAAGIAVVSTAAMLFTSVNAAWLVVAGGLAGLILQGIHKEEGK